jgi:hypothetical protein
MLKDKLYSEILDEFRDCETKEQRLAVLKRYDHPRFKSFLFYAFSSNIKFDVEIPTYRDAVEPAGLNHTYLHNEVDKMYLFIKDHPARPDGLTPEKQKQLLLVILESLYKDEAALMVKMMNKNLSVSNLTKKIILEAYPDLNL